MTTSKYVVDPTLDCHLHPDHGVRYVHHHRHHHRPLPYLRTTAVPVMDVEVLVICQVYPEVVRRVWDTLVDRVLATIDIGAVRQPRLREVHHPLGSTLNCSLIWVSALEQSRNRPPSIAKHNKPVYGRIVTPTVRNRVEELLRAGSDRLGLHHHHDTKYFEVTLARMMVLLNPELAKVIQPTEQVVMVNPRQVSVMSTGQRMTQRTYRCRRPMTSGVHLPAACVHYHDSW